MLEEGIHLANYFRNTGLSIELLAKEDKYMIEDYLSYGKRMNIGGILYLQSPKKVQVYDIEKATKNEVLIEDLMLGDD